jgi:hypothetical protein
MGDTWSEHSERKILPSLMAAIGTVSKPHQDMLGRWLEGGSHDYVQSASSVITRAQMEVTARMSSLASWYDEYDVHDRIKDTLIRAGDLDEAFLADTVKKLDFKVAGHAFNSETQYNDMASSSSQVILNPDVGDRVEDDDPQPKVRRVTPVIKEPEAAQQVEPF